MTPSDLEILVHCHVSPDPHPRLHAPAVKDAIRQFLADGIIKRVSVDIYGSTERGEMWLEMILDTPMPVYQLVDPRKLGPTLEES